MKYIIKFSFLLFIFQGAFSQNNAIKDIQSILKKGQYNFNLIEIPTEKRNYSETDLVINPITAEISLDDEVFRELENSEDRVSFDSIRVEIIKIIYQDSIIKIVPLNKNLPVVTINLLTTTVQFYDEKLEYYYPITVEESDNIFNSSWKGYLWKSTKNNNEKSMNYEFIIGETSKSGNIYIKIKGYNSNGIFNEFRLLN
jgi:hypothetical protein